MSNSTMCMKIYILFAVNKENPDVEQFWGVYATYKRAEEQIEIEIEAYGGVDECHLEFLIKEDKIRV